MNKETSVKSHNTIRQTIFLWFNECVILIIKLLIH
jgi:hypothetical protein